jgi:hypothetical protein
MTRRARIDLWLAALNCCRNPRPQVVPKRIELTAGLVIAVIRALAVREAQ